MKSQRRSISSTLGQCVMIVSASLVPFVLHVPACLAADSRDQVAQSTASRPIKLGGKQYLNASDIRIVDGKIRVIHSEGISSVPLSQIAPEEVPDLPADVRREIGTVDKPANGGHVTDKSPESVTVALDGSALRIGGKTISDAQSAEISQSTAIIRSPHGSVEVGLYDISPSELEGLPKPLQDRVMGTMLFASGPSRVTAVSDLSVSTPIHTLGEMLEDQYGIYLSVDPILDLKSSPVAEINFRLTKGDDVFGVLSNALAALTRDITVFPMTSNIWFVGASSALNAERARLAFRRGDMEAFRKWARESAGETRLGNFHAVEKLLNRFDTDLSKPVARLIEIEEEAINNERARRSHIRTLGILFGQLRAGWDAATREKAREYTDPARIDASDIAEKGYTKMLVTHRPQIESAIKGLNDCAKRENDLGEQVEVIEDRIEDVDDSLWAMVGEVLNTGGVGVGSGELRRPVVQELSEYLRAAARLNGQRKLRLTEIQETREANDRYLKDALDGGSQWTVDFRSPLQDGVRGLSSARIQYLKRDFYIIKTLQEMASLLAVDDDGIASDASGMTFEPGNVTRETFSALLSDRYKWDGDVSLRGRVILGLARVLGSRLQKVEVNQWLSQGGGGLPGRAQACLEEVGEFLKGKKPLDAIQIGRGKGRDGVARGLVVITGAKGRVGEGRVSDVSVSLMATRPSGRALQDLLPKEWNVMADKDVFCSFVAPRERVGVDMLVSIRDAALWVKAQEIRHSRGGGKYSVVHFDETLLSMGRAGDSAGVAFAAAMHSAFSGNPGNTRVAVTGAIHPKGEIRAVGGVDRKIDGAINAACDFVIIPGANRGVIYELPLRSLLGIQVLESKEASEAVPFLSMAEGTEDFLVAVGTAYWSGIHMWLQGKDAVARQILKGLLEKMPGHLSARRLLEIVGDGEGPAEMPEVVQKVIDEKLIRKIVDKSHERLDESVANRTSGARSGGGIAVGRDTGGGAADVKEALEMARADLKENNVRGAFLAFEEARKSHELSGGNAEGASQLAEFGLEIFETARKAGDFPVASSALYTSLGLTRHNPKVSETVIGVFDDLKRMVQRGQVAEAMEQLRYLEGVGLEQNALVSRYREELSNALIDASWRALMRLQFGRAGGGINAAKSLWPQNPRLGWIRTARGASFFLGIMIGLFTIFKGVEKLYWWLNRG